jgi:hypothetical protein
MRALGLATVGAAVVTGAPASAEIVSSGEVNLLLEAAIDLDGDGTYDYLFDWTDGKEGGLVYLQAAPTATFVGGPARLAAGQLIGDGLPFSPPGSTGLLWNWDGANPVTGYIGAGFMIGSDLHYGWIQYTAFGHNDGMVVQWAYEDIPGAPIEAGATGICPADIDGDGVVGIGDFLIVLGAWGGPGGDTNGDGTTDILDFLAVLGGWGPCP